MARGPATPHSDAVSGGGDAVDDDVRQWLYDGERLSCAFSLSPGWVALTSHRLLAFDPENDGRRFESYHRPNVRGVEVTTGGDTSSLERVPSLAVYALFALGGWAVLRGLSLQSLSGVRDDSVTAMVSPVFGLLETVVSLLATALLVGGLGLGFVVAVLTWRYVASRGRRLVVDVAGADAVTVRLPPGRAAAVDRLQEALDDDGADDPDEWLFDTVTDRTVDR